VNLWLRTLLRGGPLLFLGAPPRVIMAVVLMDVVLGARPRLMTMVSVPALICGRPLCTHAAAHLILQHKRRFGSRARAHFTSFGGRAPCEPVVVRTCIHDRNGHHGTFRGRPPLRVLGGLPRVHEDGLGEDFRFSPGRIIPLVASVTQSRTPDIQECHPALAAAPTGVLKTTSHRLFRVVKQVLFLISDTNPIPETRLNGIG